MLYITICHNICHEETEEEHHCIRLIHSAETGRSASMFDLVPLALRLNLILPNEAAYFMTHLDEGLETIRERFWESLK